jgi:periplasmic divalent cation tolerance protein
MENTQEEPQAPLHHSLDPVAIAYVTFPDEDSALALGKKCVQARLAASANIYPGIRSIYWWKGELEEAGECSLILKTRSDLTGPLEAFLTEHHPYEIPCILTWETQTANAPYAQWLRAETLPPKSHPKIGS